MVYVVIKDCDSVCGICSDRKMLIIMIYLVIGDYVEVCVIRDYEDVYSRFCSYVYVIRIEIMYKFMICVFID